MSKDEADEDQGIISSCFQTPPCIVHIAAFVCVDTHSACPYSYQASVDSETCTHGIWFPSLHENCLGVGPDANYMYTVYGEQGCHCYFFPKMTITSRADCMVTRLSASDYY